MEIIKINNLSKCNDIRQLYEESFPPEEKVNFDEFFSGVFCNFSLYGAYDHDQLIGMIHFANTKNFIHLNYFAIDKNHQSQGYGSKILDWLKNEFNNKTIVVDVEELDANAINSHNRIRRKVFYNKNEFVDGQYIFDWEGTKMTYLHYKDIDADEFMKYIQIIFPTITNIRKK